MIQTIKQKWQRYGLGISLGGLSAAVLLHLGGRTEAAQVLAVLSLLAMAFGFRSHAALRGYAFTLFIFTAVAAALFYPDFFKTMGSFELKQLIVPLLQLIMFGMGTAMSLRDFAGVVKMPLGVGVGVFCQLSIMPLSGFAIAASSGLPPEIAAGIVLVGCAPSGIASNVICFLARANVALSVTLTSVITLLAPFTTPWLMRLLAGQFIPVDPREMMMSIVKMVIVPVAAGLLFHHLLHGKSAWLDRAMPVLSMAGIAVIIAIITAAGRDSLMQVGLVLMLAAVAHNTLGYLTGYWLCRLLRMPEQDCRTISIEVGMQNSGLASGIALEMGKMATVGLAPAVFGPFMNISGSVLASWWRGRQAKEPLTKL
jgi:BASS family bile acid:Na+ symporter